ncbi:MAG: GNAT family N-acetyltransferase [Opitutae bacterium]|nr:GNAT family N-acetyltransferase [Opitutae bacterium]
MSSTRRLDIHPMRAPDRAWAAGVMAASEPWLTLGRGRADALKLLRNRRKLCFIVRSGGARAGFLVLDLNGPLGGYIQTIGVAPEMRGRGIGTAALRWAEAHIFQKHRNVLLCVSSFNRGALRLYRRAGYAVVGRLRDYVIAGHAEILLRKTLGPLSRSTTQRTRRATEKTPRQKKSL